MIKNMPVDPLQACFFRINYDNPHNNTHNQTRWLS
jgi:hypothetical protein